MTSIVFRIPLERGALGSEVATAFLRLRHQIERDMVARSLKVDGGGMGLKEMEVFVDSTQPDQDVATGIAVVQSYGLTCKTAIFDFGVDNDPDGVGAEATHIHDQREDEDGAQT